MPTNLRDYIAKLSPEDQAEIATGTAALVAEEANLRQLREARRRSQTEIAQRLKIKQSAVSKLERRTDIYVSTLRKYIEAMGGELEITARFPDRVVKVGHFGDVG